MKYFDTQYPLFPGQAGRKALPKLREISNYTYIYWHSGRYSEKPGSLGLRRGHGHCTSPPNAHQQTSVNDFAQESQGGNIYCFGSVYPFAENAVEELHRVKEMGLYGIKFHPDYQEFFIDDPAALSLYAEAERMGLPVAFHTGRDPLSPEVIHCQPQVLGKIAEMFPKLTIIAAHMGGMELPQEAAQYLAGKKNVYFDTAFASHFLTASQLGELIHLHGADRVLFATDCPWSTVPDEQALLEAAGLTPAEKEQIAYRNAEELFGITV